MSWCATETAVFSSKLSSNTLLYCHLQKKKQFFLTLHGADYRVISHGPGEGCLCWTNRACHSPFQTHAHLPLFFL